MAISEAYIHAKRLGLKEYSSYISQGRNGYLPYLDGILKNIDIVSEVDLGIIDIPLKKVKGTYTYMRSLSFARNFMPLMDEDSEFAHKWEAVYRAQITEGLRDPVKVYEYLNWFYVIEGNKRISVLKYLDVLRYNANVIRMIPKYDEKNKDIRLYYAFLKFYKNTGINNIWFSEEKSFYELWRLIKNYEPPGAAYKTQDRFKYFASAVYGVFRKVYLELGGQRLPITTGDAFLDFIKINGVPEQYDDEDLKPLLRRFIVELEYYKRSGIEVQTEPDLKVEGGFFNRLSTIIRHGDRIKVGFALAKDIKTSSWSYAHELGRMHLERVMGDNVSTISIDNVPESSDAYAGLNELVNQGCQVVFSTSPLMINATLKIAMEHPNIVFLNCSGTYSFKHVHTYFGRIHEPRFLSGIVAGSLTKSNKIGYAAACAIPEVISGINAFAIGAKMVNPRVEIFVEWTGEWDDEEKSKEAVNIMASAGADVICHHNTLAYRKFSKMYGVFTVVPDDSSGAFVPDRYLAVPVWNWGIFYEKMTRSILSGATRPYGDTQTSGKRIFRSYWWGMDSDIIDFFYSRRAVPSQTQKLVEIMKDVIKNGKFHIFSGPLYDQKGVLRLPEGKDASRREILSMDWLVDFVHGSVSKCENSNLLTDLTTGKMIR
ncbi:MAG TPA: BMP family ABC transporter substrate-binding protein [Clostridia bacterium]